MPKYQIPTLDFAAVSAMDDDARTAALDAYRAELTTLEQTLAEAEQCDAERESALHAARYDAAKYKMASDKSLDGFADAIDEIETVLAETPALAALPDEERLRTAYYIVRGRRPAPTPAPEPTAEELFAALKKNPAAMRLCEARMLQMLGADPTPALMATAGNATAPLTVKEKPKTIDEASGLARAAFGI